MKTPPQTQCLKNAALLARVVSETEKWAADIVHITFTVISEKILNQRNFYENSTVSKRIFNRGTKTMKKILYVILEQWADWELAYISSAVNMLGQG